MIQRHQLQTYMVSNLVKFCQYIILLFIWCYPSFHQIGLRCNWFWNDIDWKDVEPKTLSLTLTLILTWYELFEWVLYFIWKHPFPWSHKSLLWSTFLCTNFFYPIESLWPFSWYVVVCWFFSNPQEKTENRKLNYTAFWLFCKLF